MFFMQTLQIPVQTEEQGQNAQKQGRIISDNAETEK